MEGFVTGIDIQDGQWWMAISIKFDMYDAKIQLPVSAEDAHQLVGRDIRLKIEAA